jgi:hypothetical protein
LGDSVFFEAINLTLTVSEIYDRVDNADVLAFVEQEQEQEQQKQQN